ncbi:MAG TPA: hypothetical protein VKM55_04245 [Candidatus Lokiarchaeia archaeon]|nr:hypothetical protein [Candidatus Lokiarchaeia archaeon]
MPKRQKTKKAARKIYHLTPLEAEAIKNARLAGTRVKNLADQYGVSRQTIYVATRKNPKDGNSNEGTEANQDEMVIPKKRRRSRRIPAEIRDGIIEMKIKYPKWGVAYLRGQWVKAGNPPVSPASIYRMLHGAGLQTRELVEKEVYQRFEMTRPGQLWQTDGQKAKGRSRHTRSINSMLIYRHISKRNITRAFTVARTRHRSRVSFLKACVPLPRR